MYLYLVFSFQKVIVVVFETCWVFRRVACTRAARRKFILQHISETKKKFTFLTYLLSHIYFTKWISDAQMNPCKIELEMHHWPPSWFTGGVAPVGVSFIFMENMFKIISRCPLLVYPFWLFTCIDVKLWVIIMYL